MSALLQRPLVAVGAGGTVLIAIAGLAFALWPAADSAKTDSASMQPPAAPLVAYDADDSPTVPTTTAPNSLLSADASSATPTANDSVGASPANNLIAAHAEQPAATPALPELPPPAPPPAVAHAAPAQPSAGPPATTQLPAHQQPITQPSSAPAATDTPTRQPVLKFDPLDFDPSQLSLSTPASPPSDNRPRATTAPPSAGQAATANDNSVGSAPGSDSPDAGADAALLPPDADPSVAVRRGPPSNETPRRRDAAAQLALPIQSLTLQGVPLDRLLATLSDMSGLSITLDPAALDMTGVSPRRAVNLDVREMPLERVLRQVLAIHRLDFVERGGQLIVFRPTAEGHATREYDVQDLLADDADAARLADLVRRFVAPASWQPAGGQGAIEAAGPKLRIHQTEDIYIQIIVFCERLRRARRLPTKTSYTPERLAIESPYALLAPKLREPTTFTFLPWTRLADVVRHWQAQSGLVILVDWPALASVELEPSSPIACGVIKLPWGEAMDDVLGPLDLGWWAIDGETIQITSRDSLPGVRRIELHPVSADFARPFPDAGAMLAALTQELRENVGEGGRAGGFALAYDEPGKRLILLGNAAAQRYLAERLSAK
jgi:hypothetical protein